MRYQLVYNGHPDAVLLDTLKEAEGFKQRASNVWPEMVVEIVTVKEELNV
mgnify:FL=1